MSLRHLLGLTVALLASAFLWGVVIAFYPFIWTKARLKSLGKEVMSDA